MTDLRPCPGCGDGGDPHCVRSEIILTYSVECVACGFEGPSEDTADKATEAWNHRPIEDALRARAESSEAEVDRLQGVVCTWTAQNTCLQDKIASQRSEIGRLEHQWSHRRASFLRWAQRVASERDAALARLFELEVREAQS